MAGVLRTAQKAAASSIPVLIEGESGVGKELFARAIHGSGERKSKPFVAVNCGAIPDNLVEFDPVRPREGRLHRRHRTPHRQVRRSITAARCFSTRSRNCRSTAQVKLLRALQEGAVEAVGGRKPVKVDVRIVSATNRKLLDRVKGGHFREDLFYRLHVLPLTIPPLRARREDIPHLLRHFLARFGAEENRTITGITGEAMAHLSQLDWPGNIRQLENAVYRAVVMSDGDQLGLADFPLVQAHAAATADVHSEPLIVSPAIQPRRRVVSGNEIPISPLPANGSLSMLTAAGEVRPLEEMENEIIRFAISHYRGQMSEVARRLKIGRSTLYRKLDEASADDGQPEEREPERTAACKIASQVSAISEHSNRGLQVTDK